MAEKKKQVRRLSRITAVETLFAYFARDEKISLEETFLYVLNNVQEKEEDDFARKIVETAIENIGKIKVTIRAFASDFTFDKIVPINRAILVSGVCEMQYFETPPVVIINEYIEIAKEFGEDRSAAFINGVLDNLRKGLGKKREEADKK